MKDVFMRLSRLGIRPRVILERKNKKNNKSKTYQEPPQIVYYPLLHGSPQVVYPSVPLNMGYSQNSGEHSY